MKKIFVVGSMLLLAACSWVTPSLNSQQVALVKPGVVQSCQKLGETTSKTLTKVTVLPRSQKKVLMELITLAKNEAAIMGGDTITSRTDAVSGVQVFEVYRCHSDY